MRKSFKIALIGLGSIGTRHLNNLNAILTERGVLHSIDLIRSGKGHELDGEIARKVNHVYCSYDSVPADYDVIFVTNPTYLHLQTIKQYVKKTKHMFIEKPVFDKTEIDLSSLNLNQSSVYYVACPLRYTAVIQYIKNNIELKNVFSARVICSSYLPEWRPNIDYRRTYSAYSTQGGGVSVDLIHEWDYLTYLFGYPIRALNIKGQFSNLQIDSDDLAIYIAKYPDKLIEVHLDYFGRHSIREIQLFMDNDTVVGDLLRSEIKFLNSGKVLSFGEQRNECYRKEIICFFDMIEGKETNHNDISHALEILRITQGDYE